YRAGDRIVAFVVDIDKTARGPQIILSRTHKGLLEKLFEMEVPEIYEKIVRIEASAREAGARSKIAVSSRDRDVDPVGACVGKKGQRVRLASQLTGWRIDIHSESKVREMEQRSRVSMAAIEGVGTEIADTLFKLGWRSAADVANAKPE